MSYIDSTVSVAEKITHTPNQKKSCNIVSFAAYEMIIVIIIL